MTLGGAVVGIGLDGRGLGEAGISLISMGECNDQGDGQREDLDGQQQDCAANPLGRALENWLVVHISVVEVFRCCSLHLAKIGSAGPGGLEHLASKKSDMDTAREQGGPAFADADGVGDGSAAERDRNLGRPMSNCKGGDGYDD